MTDIPPSAPPSLSPAEAAIATDAYIFGFPFVYAPDGSLTFYI